MRTYRVKVYVNWFWQFLSWKMPRKLLYFAVIRAWAMASVDKFPSKTPDQITWSDVIKYLEEK